MIANLEAFHILPANINDKINLRHHFLRRSQMSHRFYQTIIQRERIFNQFFPVAGSRTAHNVQLRIYTVNLLQGFPHQFYGLPITQHIFMEQNFILFPNNY